MSDITETLKRKLDELDLDRRLDEAVDVAERTFQEVLGQTGTFVHERREDIDRLLDGAGEKINDNTSHAYADQLTRVRAHIDAGVARLAERRPPTPDQEGPTEPAS